jgi:ribosomal protein S18 acetylase RimI-like enzyme
MRIKRKGFIGFHTPLGGIMIGHAEEKDIAGILALDGHIEERTLRDKIRRDEVYIVREGNEIVGTLRYSLFWDNTPFMNMLKIKEAYQKKGLGSSLVLFWEKEMMQEKHACVMTSTQADESAQHFYRKIGYVDIGGFVLPNEPLEIMLYKNFG